jgi:ketosteroid isomerase-like protein
MLRRRCPLENVELVRNGVQAWIAGDMAAIFALWHEEIEWTAPPEDPDQVDVVGSAAAGEAMAKWIATWEAYSYQLDDIIDAGHEVIQAGRQVMVARDAEVSSEIFFVWTIRERRAVRMRMFYHRDQALEAAGLRE